MLDMEAAKRTLTERLLARMPEAGNYTTAIEGVGIHRRDNPDSPEHCFRVPRIVKIVQGQKRSLVGAEEFLYGDDDVFIAGVEMPNTSNVLTASPDKPIMSFTVDLDKNLIGQLALEIGETALDESGSGTGILVQRATPLIMDAFLRLEALLDRPDDIPVMSSLIIKELHFRVLTGPGGQTLRMLHTYGSQKNHITRAIAWLRENFKERIAIEDLAEKAHMAPTTFHRHFREVTSVSPLQYQKRLRLHEAQRLMLLYDMDAGGASDAVGYESLTQFNREYKRLFGEPPRRNVTRWLREHADVSADLVND